MFDYKILERKHTEIIALSEIKKLLRITDNEQDNELLTYHNAALDYVEKYLSVNYIEKRVLLTKSIKASRHIHLPTNIKEIISCNIVSENGKAYNIPKDELRIIGKSIIAPYLIHNAIIEIEFLTSITTDLAPMIKQALVEHIRIMFEGEVNKDEFYTKVESIYNKFKHIRIGA